jgi:hypothetical protein
MTLTEIYNRIVFNIYGDTTPPTSVGTHLQGDVGLIAQCHKKMQREWSYSFMEAEAFLPLLDGADFAALPPDFKNEINARIWGDVSTYFTNFPNAGAGVVLLAPDNTGFTIGDTVDVISAGGVEETTLTGVTAGSTLTATLALDHSMFGSLGAIQQGNFTLSGTATQFKTREAIHYHIGKTYYRKPITDNLVFSAANTINTGTAAGFYWGAWLVQINAAGTVSTKPSGGLADQVYATEAAAITALPGSDALNCAIGFITVQTKTGARWTANTDDMTAGSDCTVAYFYDMLPYRRMIGKESYWTGLSKIEQATMDDYMPYPITTEQMPELYSIWLPDYVKVYPTPDKNYVIDLKYYRYITPYSNDPICTVGSEALINMVTHELASIMDYSQKIELFGRKYQDSIQQLRIDSAKRRNAGFDYLPYSGL